MHRVTPQRITATNGVSSPKNTRSLPKIREGTTKGKASRKENQDRRTKAPLRDNREKSGIPRNINYYRHLINDHDSTQDSVEWVLKLRSPSQHTTSTSKFESTVIQPPSVAEKSLESQVSRRQTVDIDTRNNLHQLSHLFEKRLGPSPSRDTVVFETSLRTYASGSDFLTKLEKNFRPFPKKDRLGESQIMYPSYEEMQQIKIWTTKNPNIKIHSAFDGYTSFPKYEEICKSSKKNLAEMGHLLTAPGQHMSLASWQLSMRDYNDTPLKRANSNERSSLGELKKVNRKPKRV